MFFKNDPTYQYVAESVSQLTEAGRGGELGFASACVCTCNSGGIYLLLDSLIVCLYNIYTYEYINQPVRVSKN